jgi:hypothetical protein
MRATQEAAGVESIGGIADELEPEIEVSGTGDEGSETDDEDDADKKPAPSHSALQAQKIQLALHGDKNQRMAILREPNRLLHGYVLRNPQLTIEEVVAMARASASSAELLTQISNRREWAEKPEVAIGLVRNPKTPVPVAVRMLEHISMNELRNIAKMKNVRDAIQAAARKKILG